jgi:hypothetical protein
MKRRLSRLAGALVGLYLVAEIAAWLTVSVSQGRLFWLAELDRQRTAVIASAPAASESLKGPQLEGHMGSEVLHPYVGFVQNHDLGLAPDQVHSIDRYGYFNFIRPLPRRAPDRLNVAIVGGSLASILGMQQEERLIQSLKALPAFATKQIEVTNLALGGYKQPQQLMSLLYLLAQGAELDIVLNLDGFNDVALHPTENALANVSPLFPRGWSLRTSTVVEPAQLEAIGEIMFLRSQRAQVASSHARSPWRYSALANLRWLLRDRSIGNRLYQLRRALPHLAPSGTYGTTGPTVSYDSEAQMLEDLSQIWARCSLLIERMTRGNGGRYYHFLQPNQYFPGSKKMGAAERELAWDGRSPYRALVEKGYPYLIKKGEELRKQGVRFHDLTMVFAGHDEPLYGDNCCHPNGDGNRLLVAAMVKAIAADLNGKSR